MYAFACLHRKTTASQGHQEGIMPVLPGAKEATTDCVHAQTRPGEERENLRGTARGRARSGGGGPDASLPERACEGCAQVAERRSATFGINGTVQSGDVRWSMKAP